MPKTKVVILGGGVAGMSAAQELAERGFEVHVFEKALLAGGKARSIPVLEMEDDHGGKRTREAAEAAWRNYAAGQPLRPHQHRPWLPGEHGFRFFPSFYQHVVDTMARIPYGNRRVTDNLVATTRVLLSRFDAPGLEMPVRFPHTLAEMQVVLNDFGALMSGHAGVPVDEFSFFAARVWQVMTSCSKRRMDEYEQFNWWKFIEADRMSHGYQRMLGYGITRSLVAAQADKASTRTIGDIFLQLLFGIADPQVATSDRLLNGPTNHVWIGPWLRHLQSLGVRYHFDSAVTGIHYANGRIRDASIRGGDGRTRTVEGDYFILAVPIERVVPLLTPQLTAAAPSLAALPELSKNVQWMNGIQYYLRRDEPIVHGHAIFVDSPWALTSVSQNQFWEEFDFADYGDGQVRGILSVDISDWTTPGLNGKTAMECTREEVAAEVWQQLKRSLNHEREILRDEDLHFWYLDPDIKADPGARGHLDNVEPLLVNLVDTWKLRPDAVTGIPNFFLASDYVRTHTDLATMEGANEAARRAVNGILTQTRSAADPCRIWPLHEPEILRPFREYDLARCNAGLPWDGQMTDAAVGLLGVALKSSRAIGGEDLMRMAGQFLESSTAPAPAAAARPRVRIVHR